MSLFNLFLYLALIFVLFNVVISMLIVYKLRKRNFKINFFLLRLYIPKYVHQYKEITLQESGRAGILFYWWILSINLALVLFIVALVIKAY